MRGTVYRTGDAFKDPSFEGDGFEGDAFEGEAASIDASSGDGQALQSPQRGEIAGDDLIRLRPRADRVVLAFGDTVLCSHLDGAIAPEEECGLFIHETRLLSRYRCRIGGHRLHPLTQSHIHQHQWLGYYLIVPDGKSLRDAAQNAIELRWTRAVGGGLHEDLDLANYSRRPVTLRLALDWEADFADLNETQTERRQCGETAYRTRRHAAGGRWRADYRMARRWQHQGHGGHARIERAIELDLRADSALRRLSRRGALFELSLAPGERWHACLDWRATIDGAPLPAPPCTCGRPAPHDDGEQRGETAQAPPAERASDDSAEAATERFLARATAFATEPRRTLAPVVAATLRRARRDLASLRLRRLDLGEEAWTVAAGAPTYAAFFGRDAALAAWQSALLAPDLLRGTLAVLHDTRGRRIDDWRDEQPQRLLHEMRSGPLSALRYNPFGRYYGALNSSTLFSIALLQLWRWHGERDTVAGLLDTAVGALDWLERHAREGRHGFYAYATRSRQGLKNQAWKDSGDALVYPDGREVEQPAAACEEQAEAYRAQLSLAVLLAEFGRDDEARAWYRRAVDLRERFEQAFWSDEHGYYALALDRHGEPVHSAASNPLHCLSSGIASPQRARLTMQRLLQDDLFSGWGIRTLSCRHPAYNPYAYHRGTVWPAEHGPLAIGAMRYGLREQAQSICRAQFEAAALFDHNRLPECFGGHPRDRGHPFPGLYPYANTPQAWSATSALSLVQALCGLHASAPQGRLWVDPQLPEWLPQLSLEHLRVGDCVVDLRFERQRDGRTAFDLRHRRGELRVERRPMRWPQHHSLDDLLAAERG